MLVEIPFTVMLWVLAERIKVESQLSVAGGLNKNDPHRLINLNA